MYWYLVRATVGVLVATYQVVRAQGGRSGGLAYGFTATGEVVLIDPVTAAVTPLASTWLQWTGAATAP